MMGTHKMVMDAPAAATKKLAGPAELELHPQCAHPSAEIPSNTVMNSVIMVYQYEWMGVPTHVWWIVVGFALVQLVSFLPVFRRRFSVVMVFMSSLEVSFVMMATILMEMAVVAPVPFSLGLSAPMLSRPHSVADAETGNRTLGKFAMMGTK